MTAFGWMTILLWISFIVTWAIASFLVKERTHGKDAFEWFTTRGIAIAALVGFFHLQVFDAGPVTRLPAESPPFLTSLSGVLICAAGLIFAILARMHLGLNWGMPMTEAKDPKLITSGPYAHVRHPIYTGVLLAMLGSALVFGEIWLSLFMVFFVYFIYASTQEEKVLTQRFTEEYEAYKKRSKMLIPFLF
jgi:protein-S-isoprenylcysteine O-methyltransferase Ste14